MFSEGDISAARKRISKFVIKTPPERNQTPSKLVGTNIYLNMDLFQKTGSFKPRGAFNQILQLGDTARTQGVVAFSGVMAQSLSNFGRRIISSPLMKTGRYSVILFMNDRI